MRIKLSGKDAFNWNNIRLNLIICAGITVLLTALFWLQYRGNFFHVILSTFIYSYSIGFSIYFSLTVINIKVESLFFHYLFTLIRIIISTAIGVIIANLFFLVVYGKTILRNNIASVAFLIFTGLLFGITALTIFYYFHLSEERKIKHLKEQEKKTKAELRALVSQINPHFLFNTLNTISSLIHLDPDKADEMIVMLSKVFRHSLQSGKKKFVSIAEELRVVEYYLQIEKVRFSERLKFHINAEEKCLKFAIPPLILQTLVENSVKHGISPKLEGGEVNINLNYINDSIEIRIEDNGIGISDNKKNGFGLDAVRNILELQYDRHKFELKNENGVKIRIVIPKVRLNDEI